MKKKVSNRRTVPVQRSVVVEGWSTFPLQTSDWSKGSVVRLYPKHMTELNPDRVVLCSDARHAACVKEKACDSCRPRCTSDELRMVGKGLSSDLTAADKKKIRQMLTRFARQCRKVHITVAVEPLRKIQAGD